MTSLKKQKNLNIDLIEGNKVVKFIQSNIIQMGFAGTTILLIAVMAWLFHDISGRIMDKQDLFMAELMEQRKEELIANKEETAAKIKLAESLQHLADEIENHN